MLIWHPDPLPWISTRQSLTEGLGGRHGQVSNTPQGQEQGPEGRTSERHQQVPAHDEGRGLEGGGGRTPD